MDNRRLMPLLLFFFSLFMLWNEWQKYNQPKVAMQATASSATVGGSSVPPPSAMQPAGIPSVPSVAPMPSAAKGELISISTDVFVVQVSTQGGDIVGLEFNDYKSTVDQTKPLWLFEAKHQYAAQSGLIGTGLPNHKTLFNVVAGSRELGPDDKTLTLRLEAPVADGVKVTKIYTFTRGSYLINVAHEIVNGSKSEVAAQAYYQLQRDTTAPEGESRMVSTYTGPAEYTEQDKYQKISFSDIEKGKAKFNALADNGWMAMVQHYFVSAWIPEEKVQREFYAEKLDAGSNPTVRVGIKTIVPVAAPGSTVNNSVSLYAGPQIQSVLDQLAKPAAEGGIGAQGLPLVVDYGWLTIVAAPIFWCLEFIHNIVGNWGWAIVLLTICIKALFFPLSAASYKSMAKMKAITPRMTALRERCGDDKQKLNMEMMNLYKTEKINPLGGCLPILVQIPVFIALYWALLGAVEMRGAPWVLWIKDLSSQDPYYVLPIIMILTMVIQTKLNPTPPDPIQAKITKYMPFIFGGMFFFFPSGLVLYWVVNNVLSIAQQWQITRMIERGRKAANDAKA